MRLRGMLLAGALLLGSGAAHADTIKTFDFNGTLQNGLLFTGSAVIDTTTGVVESGTAMVPDGTETSTFSYRVLSTTPAYSLDFQDSLTDVLQLELPESTSLVNFSGSTLCSTSFTADCPTAANLQASLSLNHEAGLDLVTSGSIAVTPEPSSVLLLGTGLLAMAWFARRQLA